MFIKNDNELWNFQLIPGFINFEIEAFQLIINSVCILSVY